MTTPIDLDETDAICAAATPGPWRAMRDGNSHLYERVVGASRIPELASPYNRSALANRCVHEVVLLDADADFIAHARTALSAASAELRELRARVALYEEALVRITDDAEDVATNRSADVDDLLMFLRRAHDEARAALKGESR